MYNRQYGNDVIINFMEIKLITIESIEVKEVQCQKDTYRQDKSKLPSNGYFNNIHDK